MRQHLTGCCKRREQARSRPRVSSPACLSGLSVFIKEPGEAVGAAVLERVLQHSNRSFVQSPDYDWEQRTGRMETPQIVRYHRELIPGVSLVVLDLTCGFLDPSQGPLEIWLARAGIDGDFKADPAVGYRMPLPERLQRAAWPAFERAALHNAEVPLSDGPQYSVPPR